MSGDLRPGDRVHYPGDPSDVGTLARDGDHPRLVVHWDRLSDGLPDVDECEPDGTVATHDAPGRLVLAHRHASSRLADRRARWARVRFWRLMKAADVAEGVAHVG